MSLSGLSSSREFQNSIRGTMGSFETPAGRVQYLMTKARIGKPATDPERRLTEHLVPFREVISSEHLDFNQLLQRDLDDHRVSIGLVPYLLEGVGTGPAFFPPIVAVALPFESSVPSKFPELSGPKNVESDGLHWKEYTAGRHLRTRRLIHETEKSESEIALGEFSWNSEFCKVVVIDGQHRAMALLAIDRTVRDTWELSGKGARYKYFYENRVRSLLKGREIKDTEVPVTLLWFPDLFGAGANPHKAARKLFVDVNKEARTPSQSRLILLSDTELINVLTRSTLALLRNQSNDEFLPLFCVG